MIQRNYNFHGIKKLYSIIFISRVFYPHYLPLFLKYEENN